VAESTRNGEGWHKTTMQEVQYKSASVNDVVLQYVLLTTTGQENRVVCCAGGNKGVTVPEKYLPQAAARTSGAEEAKLYVHTRVCQDWK